MYDLTIKAIKGIFNSKNLTEEQIKKYKRYGKEFISNLTGIYIYDDLALSIIIDCRTPTTIEFRSKLRFKQHDIILIKKQSVLTKIMKVFASKEILLQRYVLSYRINLDFLEYKLAIEVNEKGHKDRDEHKEIERQKAIEEELDCKFIRINSDEKGFDVDVYISKIHNHIVELSKTSLIN